MKVKKIMFAHASRGRPVKAMDAAKRMTGMMTENTPFTYYLSLDIDDPFLPDYIHNVETLDFKVEILVRNNRGCVDATNRVLKFCQDEDLLIVNTEDLGIKTIGWDKFLIEFIDKISHNEYMVHFPDAAPNAKECAIYQVLSISLCKKLGYIFYPRYISMYADNDLWSTCRRLGVVNNYDGPLLFFHDHPGHGSKTMEWDETYKHTNRPICYENGAALFAKRFPKIN